MNWQEAARAILDRAVKQGIITSDHRSELKGVIGKGNAIQASQYLRHLSDLQYCRHLSAVPVPGWNKVWAGNTLIGWWGEIVTEEPIRLVAIELTRYENVGEEIRQFLMARWNDSTESVLTPEAKNLCRELGLGTESGRLSQPELRFLQRVNLDRHENVIVEKWGWSKQAGVAFLSDGGRETIRPELACSKAIESISSEDGKIPDEWRLRLSGFQKNDECLEVADLPQYVQFITTIEYWGLGQAWSGGVKLFLPAQEWLKKLAAELSSPCGI